MIRNTIALVLIVSLFAVSCKKEGKRRGVDYTEIKTELALSEEQDKQFDEVIEKYKKVAEENRAAATADGAKPDRVQMFKMMEERTNQQNAEMSKILDETQFQKYKAFVEKNTRKRPRYSDELLTEIKTELNLDEQQANMLEAANNAFEKSFQDAHDFYHGNGEAAKEYWEKYDKERKNAMKQVLSEEQYAKFLELVKNEGFRGKE